MSIHKLQNNIQTTSRQMRRSEYTIVPITVNHEEMELPFVRILQIRKMDTGCLSYLILGDHRALAIDPSCDIYVYQELAKYHHSRLIGAADTHYHDDHNSGGPLLTKKVGGTYFSPELAKNIAYTMLGSTITIQLKRLIIRMIPTPGHTPESVTFLAADAAFTGDTIFSEGLGKLYNDQKRVNAARLWNSIHNRLFHLPDTTVVLPAHTDPQNIYDKVPVAMLLSSLKQQFDGALLTPNLFVENLVRQS